MQNTLLDLFQKYVDNRISRVELEELMVQCGRAENREQLRNWVNTAMKDNGPPLRSEQLQHLLDGLDDRVLGKVKGFIAIENQITRRKTRWLYIPIAAAMACILAIGMAIYLYQYKNDVKGHTSGKQSLVDIRPGGNRAVLTLEGGSSIALDSSLAGVKVTNGEVHYDGGRLVTKVNTDREEAVQYATLATPKGGQYQVTLPDGTNVWLNAASSLRYPTHFVGNKREVELVGEAYFDVVTDKRRPFIVKSSGQQIRVLGTQFNINAYSNEDEVTTTLIEGSVDVVNDHSKISHLLKPGQQAKLQGNAVNIMQVNVSYYTSWKEGRFTFNRAKLPVILRQIERWYDIEFINNMDGSDVELWGALSRNVMLSELLEVLALNTGMKFEREGRRVIVSQ